MTAVQRFFRKYFLSTVGILLLFLVVNLVLVCVIVLTATKDSDDAHIPVETLAGMVTQTGEKITATKAFSDSLRENNAWAMLLDDGERSFGASGCRISCRAAIPPRRLRNSAGGICRIIPFMCGRIPRASWSSVIPKTVWSSIPSQRGKPRLWRRLSARLCFLPPTFFGAPFVLAQHA